MGIMQDGKWITKNALVETENGQFKRQDSAFRNCLGDGDFPFEAGRYVLYVSHACPWCHRTTIFRVLKKLKDHIRLVVVNAHMGDHGWAFPDGGDPVTGVQYMYELYAKAKTDYSGKVTVPVLWDTERETIVNNESADIIRMFNELGAADTPDFYPKALRSDIDAINDTVYHHVNNGVYKTGFASTQEAYEKAFNQLFTTLDDLESRLAGQSYLMGETLTEADWRLFVTLARFDAVYVGHFKCNLRRIADYPNLHAYLKRLYTHPGIAETVQMNHIKEHYYTSHPHLNPSGIIPMGPELAFTRQSV